MKENNGNAPKTLFYKKKWFIPLVVVLIIGGVISALQGEDEPYNGTIEVLAQYKATPEEHAFDASNINFTIAGIEDSSIGPNNEIRRYSFNVIVYDEVTVAQLEALSALIAENTKSEKDFNSLHFWFNDHVSIIGTGTTLGTATYAPGGSMANDGNVRAGEYSTHEFSFNLHEKDWSLRPTLEVYEIHYFWRMTQEEVYRETYPTFPDDDYVTALTAYALDITPEEVEDVLFTVQLWRLSR